MEITNLVLDVDVAPFEDLSYSTVRNMKKLMYIISQSVPFTPNIAKLSERMGVPRNSVLKILDLLHHAKGVPLSYIAADGIKGGSGNKIPLWLFGFLY